MVPVKPEITVQMPPQLRKEWLTAVRNDDLCRTEDKEEEHRRIGWLICAYDVLLRCRIEELSK